MTDPPLPGPHPRRRYDEETTTAYWDLFTEFSGQYDGWLFWMSPSFTYYIAKDRDSAVKPNEEHSCGLWMVGRDRKHAHPTVVFFGDTKGEKMTSDGLKSLRRQSSALLLRVLASRKLNASDIHIGVYGLPYQPSYLREHLEYRVYQVPNEHVLIPPTRVSVPSLDGGRFDNDQLRVITMGGLVEDKKKRMYGLIVGNFYETSFQELIASTSPGESSPAVGSAIPQPSEGESSLDQQTSQPKQKGIELSTPGQEASHPEVKSLEKLALDQHIALVTAEEPFEQSSLERQTSQPIAKKDTEQPSAEQQRSDAKAKGVEQSSPEQEISQPIATEDTERPSLEQQRSDAKAKGVEQSSPEQTIPRPTVTGDLTQTSEVEQISLAAAKEAIEQSEVTDLGDQYVQERSRSHSLKEPAPTSISRDLIGISNLSNRNTSNRAHGWMLVRLQGSKTKETQTSMPSLDPKFSPNHVATKIPTQVESESNKPQEDPNAPNAPSDTVRTTRTQIIWIVTVSGVIVANAPEIAGVIETADGKLLKIWKVMTSQTIAQEDCGSWLIHPTTHDLLGVVMEIIEDGSGALFLPAATIFAELKGFHPLGAENTSRGGALFKKPRKQQDERAATKHTGSSSRSLNSEASSTNPPSFRDIIFNRTYPCYRRSFKDKAFCKTKNGYLWELKDDERAWAEWRVLEPQLEDIISRTAPTSDSESTPNIALYAFMAGKDVSHASPMIAISCNSPQYSIQLRDAIRRSHVLGRNNFDVAVLEDDHVRQLGKDEQSDLKLRISDDEERKEAAVKLRWFRGTDAKMQKPVKVKENKQERAALAGEFSSPFVWTKKESQSERLG